MINQCDGCRAKIPLKGNLHKGKDYNSMSLCTANLYLESADEEFTRGFERSLGICREMQNRREHQHVSESVDSTGY